MRIVETDNFGGDYPNETFVNLPPTDEINCKKLVELFNTLFSGDSAPRYWKMVDNDYKLRDAGPNY